MTEKDSRGHIALSLSASTSKGAEISFLYYTFSSDTLTSYNGPFQYFNEPGCCSAVFAPVSKWPIVQFKTGAGMAPIIVPPAIQSLALSRDHDQQALHQRRALVRVALA